MNEDSGAHTVTPWATAISKGPANESGQSVDFIVSNDNTSLFSGTASGKPVRDVDVYVGAGCERFGDCDGQDPR